MAAGAGAVRRLVRRVICCCMSSMCVLKAAVLGLSLSGSVAEAADEAFDSSLAPESAGCWPDLGRKGVRGSLSVADIAVGEIAQNALGDCLHFGSHPCVKATRACVCCVAFRHVEKKKFVCVSQCSRVAVCWHWFGEWLHAWRDEARVNGLKSICGLVATACSESRMRGDNNTGTWVRGNESVSACPDWLYVREILNRTIKKNV